MSKELERLNRAQRIANIGNWDQDVLTGELWWSDQTYRIFGLVPQGVRMDYEAFLEMVLPEDRAAIAEATEAAISPSNTPYAVEYRIVRPDGEMRHLYEEAVVDRDVSGKAVRVMGVVHDVTEREKAKEALRRYEEQSRHVEKMEAVATLAGGIAHEINNILGIIVGYTGLVLENLTEVSEEAENLREVMAASMRAKELVLQVLIFSARRMGARASVDLGAVIGENLEELRRTLKPQQKLVVDLDPGVGHALVIPSQIGRLLANLLRNAQDASAESDKAIHVSLRRIAAADVPADTVPGLGRVDYARLRVQDFGAGIEKKNLPRVFDPFFTTKSTGEGRGMGLAVVHGVVAAHGGARHLQSTPGAGTTVDVYLPLCMENNRVLPSTQDENCAPRVLVADDDERLCRLTTKLLQGLGYTVDSATNGFQALELFLAAPHSYHVIFTDQSMRGLNGVGLTKKIRALRPDIPVIISTGFSDLLDEEEANRHGVTLLLHKPVARHDLQESLKRALG